MLYECYVGIGTGSYPNVTGQRRPNFKTKSRPERAKCDPDVHFKK